ncbi:MAG: trimeric intracellular cation channel family protein, partial [Micrococcales bacterium]|nr:trimeric intracellular cation channel family protein [Micrococcales bacterium]MBT5848308.1 trimeric intracellular cation channel family protein [Micrococcales bacterium]
GVLRDVLVNEVPRAFHDHQPYAAIAFAGGWVVVLLGYLQTPEYVDVFIAAVLMVVIRLLSVKFKWELFRWRYL